MPAHVKNKNSKSDIKWVQEEMEMNMELKKAWMSSETEKKSRYGYRAVGGILGIVLLMTALFFSGNAFLPSIGIPQKDPARGQKTDGICRNRNKITAGFEIATGISEKGKKNTRSRADGRKEAAAVSVETAKEKGEA